MLKNGAALRAWKGSSKSSNTFPLRRRRDAEVKNFMPANISKTLLSVQTG
jgi:hypothetical protein